VKQHAEAAQTAGFAAASLTRTQLHARTAVSRRAAAFSHAAIGAPGATVDRATGIRGTRAAAGSAIAIRGAPAVTTPAKHDSG
jgi:hypothetical protein